MKLAPLLLYGLAAALAQDGWQISGVVTYGGKAVRGAPIMVRGPEEIKEVKTDAQGRYAMKGSKPGEYTLTAYRDENFEEHVARSLTIATGTQMKADFPIAAGAILSGRVVDKEKRPVSGMLVRAFLRSVSPILPRFEETGADKTNDQGEFRMSRLPRGKYVLAVTALRALRSQKASGSTPVGATAYPIETFYPAGTDLNAAVLLDLRPGEEQSALEIVVEKQPTRCVSFKLTGDFEEDTAKGGFAAVHVGPGLGPLWGMDTEPAGENLAKGTNRICGFTPGNYRLRFQSIDSRPYLHNKSYVATTVMIEKENVDLGTINVTGPIELRGTVSLRDARTDGKIPEGILVRIVSREDRLLQVDDSSFSRVGPDGVFHAINAFAGDYAVRVFGLPAGYYVMDATQQGRSVRNGGLRGGNGDLEVRLGVDGPTVSGRVLAEDGTAIPDASVLLVPKAEGRPLVAQSDQNGAYRFTAGIAPGDYRIAAVADLIESQREDTDTIARLLAEGLDLSLGPKEAKRLDLKAR